MDGEGAGGEDGGGGRRVDAGEAGKYRPPRLEQAPLPNLLSLTDTLSLFDTHIHSHTLSLSL